MKTRGSGILLHLTSLPSPYGIGDMGPTAYRFADFLAEAGQSYWQILPLNPTNPLQGNSPYVSTSAFAGNTLLISPDFLLEDNLITRKEVESGPSFPEERVDYEAVIDFKGKLAEKAYTRFKIRGSSPEYEKFCSENESWLDGFSLFLALKAYLGGRAWSEWPQALRDREPGAMGEARALLAEEVQREKFLQYLFFRQYGMLRRYCNEKHIHIIGDIPIYVSHDSADVWMNPGLFKLDEQKKPFVVAGVPPDYFSDTGQLWGNPVYRWDVLKERGYDWWVNRITHNLRVSDLIRIDHFRGIVGYWEVPASEKTAIKGRWMEGPGYDFINYLIHTIPFLPMIAEDLGIITPDVREVMAHFNIPGMKVLLFAFGDNLSTNPYIPHNLPRNCVAYTGTHDNNTVRGWFENEATPDEKRKLFQYLGRVVAPEELPRELIRLLMMSVASIVIFPIQDILGLGKEARMNIPSTPEGNWEWRLTTRLFEAAPADWLRETTLIYGRQASADSYPADRER
jgi:4-alpha-glucanotransferase